MCIFQVDDGTICSHFFCFSTKKNPVTGDKFDPDAFDAQFETGKFSAHLAKEHSVLSKRKRLNCKEAIEAVASNQPSAKRVKLVGQKIGGVTMTPPSKSSRSSETHSETPIDIKSDDDEADTEKQPKSELEKLSSWLVRGLNQDQIKVRRAKQRAKIMCFYVYSDQKITGTMLTGAEFRDMLCEGDPNYAKLDERQAQAWVELEYELGKAFFQYATQQNRELHEGNPFAQDQHDCVTLKNHKKYSAHGMQMIFEYINWTLCMGFKPCPGGLAPQVKAQCEGVWSAMTVSRSDFCSKIQDFADLAVARELGFEEEGCQMHSGDKVGSWAIGKLTKSKNKVPVEPFPDGVALMSDLGEFAKHYSYGTRLAELHNCCDVVDSPKLKITIDHNTTRVNSKGRLLLPMMRMNKGLKLHRDQNKDIKALQITDEKFVQGAEFEAVLDATRKYTTLVQHESACNGGYKAKLFEILERSLDPFSGFVNVVDLDKQTQKVKQALRKRRTRDQMTPVGRICFDRGSQEAHRRQELHGSKMCTRDFLAAGLDLRLIGRDELPAATIAKCKAAVEEKYIATWLRMMT